MKYKLGYVYLLTNSKSNCRDCRMFINALVKKNVRTIEYSVYNDCLIIHSGAVSCLSVLANTVDITV